MTEWVRDRAVELRVDGWLLRPPRPEDTADALAMLMDPEVRQWNPVPSVADAGSAEEWLASGADWGEGDHATFSVIEAATGRFAGNVSLHRIDRSRPTRRSATGWQPGPVDAAQPRPPSPRSPPGRSPAWGSSASSCVTP